jgi:hypothetical protein
LAAMSGPGVVLFSRSSCHLCDEARAVILAERERRVFAFEEVVIDGDEALEQRYGVRVPVVTVGGREEFEFTVEPERFRRLVGR